MSARSDGERRDLIRDLHGIDLDTPFTHMVFPDGTVQWEPVTIMFGWLALALAAEAGDIDPAEAYRVAHARVQVIAPDDWYDFIMKARAFGIKLVDAEV